jgi:hypothetical protein
MPHNAGECRPSPALSFDAMRTGGKAGTSLVVSLCGIRQIPDSGFSIPLSRAGEIYGTFNFPPEQFRVASMPNSHILPEKRAEEEPAPTRPRLVLLCALCCRIVHFTNDDLARFARDGWPKCCDQKMWCSAAPLKLGSDPR